MPPAYYETDTGGLHLITISLCMIVKNEEAVLERLLKIMSEVVDQIVIMDTGSTDRTKEIAARYTQEVYDFPWTDDFAAARNAACEKAKMDYWMWMDADDVMDQEHAGRLKKLKETLDPSVDVVMMKYATGFDANGRTSFSYYRERLLKNRKGFLWQGRVHEAVTPAGNILYSDIEVQHRKIGQGDKDRNLRIYETILKEGNTLEPRHQFYYARELYYHGRYSDAIQVFGAFLQEPEGWVENKIDACLHMALCEELLGNDEKSMEALLKSFCFDTPRGEICCELGRLKLKKARFREAAYWYTQALEAQPPEQTGAFVQKDCYGFLPAIQLCVCYDHLGDYRRAWYYHLKAQKLKPEHPSVKQNQTYFESKLKSQAE